MMRYLMLLIAALPLVAGSYKARIEPYEKVTIAAEYGGKVVTLDQRDGLKRLDKRVLVIDHALESKELANDRRKLQLLEEQIRIKQRQYNRIKNLKGQSLFTKERYQNELLTLRMQKRDLLNQMARLEDTIAKKEIHLKNRYLKKLYVRKGAFVTPGMKLMDVEDIDASRIVLYVDRRDIPLLQSGHFRIDGKLTGGGYRVEKVGETTDAQYISSYRVELVKEGVADFGRVVTVETGGE